MRSSGAPTSNKAFDSDTHRHCAAACVRESTLCEAMPVCVPVNFNARHHVQAVSEYPPWE